MTKRMNRFFCDIVIVSALFVSLAASADTLARSHRIGIEGKNFVLDGRPFQIISGEMHYARIPREYWRDRMKKARAMGLNTISTYVFWNLHEPKPGIFDFSGQLDIAAFIRTAQEEGLYVILRPGPYVCAEWELGGLPAWLLADPNIVLRSRDEKFLRPAERYLQRLGRELAPLQLTRGGPIIAVQVENEYGSFDKGKAYLECIRAAIVRAGLGEVLLYTADGDAQLPDGTLPGVHAVVNFGPGDAPAAFAALEKFRPGAPIMAGEYWAGWFDQWGKRHHTTNGEQEAKKLDWMLSQGASVNIYMFHGGTTFGFMNGANVDDGNYLPQTTSYDYDAALDESGRPTKKFFAFREVIARHRQDARLPASAPTVEIPETKLTQTASLWANLPIPVKRQNPVTMESLGQSYGYILYSTMIAGPASGELVLHDLKDFAQIYIDRKPAGTLDRRLKQDHLQIDVPLGNHRLEILVENSGRINFKKELRQERKGITGVTLANHRLEGWEIYTLPMATSDISRLSFNAYTADGPAFYHGAFALKEIGDTFLDTRGFGKGTVWINGHHLGRLWSIGPQRTLYVPGVWLKKDGNVAIVFSLSFSSGDKVPKTLRGLRQPILNQNH